jgi:hypothetical protein
MNNQWKAKFNNHVPRAVICNINGQEIQDSKTSLAWETCTCLCIMYISCRASRGEGQRRHRVSPKPTAPVNHHQTRHAWKSGCACHKTRKPDPSQLIDAKGPHDSATDMRESRFGRTNNTQRAAPFPANHSRRSYASMPKSAQAPLSEWRWTCTPLDQIIRA